MEDLFAEIINPREKKLLGEARDLETSLQAQCDKGHELLEQHRRKNDKLITTVKDYFRDYRYKNEKLRNNFDVLYKGIENASCVKNLSHFEFEDFFDVPADTASNKNSLPSWLQSFKREEFDKMRDNLEVLSKKLVRARLSEEFLIERDNLSQEIDQLIDDLQLDEQAYDWIVPKEKLLHIEKHIVKLTQYDIVPPQILADIMNRSSEFARGLFNVFNEFRERTANLHSLVPQYQAETDRSLRSEFLNINFADQKILRVKRYGIHITNEDLGSLQEGRAATEKILNFIVDYFHERGVFYKTQAGGSSTISHASTFVMRSTFFEALVPPGSSLSAESVNYDNVKTHTSEFRGYNNTIFDRFPRVVFAVQITSNNWILVEIKSYPDKEVLIYDSDMRFFAGYHERLSALVRKYITEELRHKADMLEQDARDLANQYVGRTISTPQNSLPQDNAIYFAKNLALCAAGNAVHSASYRLDNINSYRLEIFTFLLRVGINVDRTLPFEILL